MIASKVAAGIERYLWGCPAFHWLATDEQIFPILLDLDQYTVVDQKTQHIGAKAM